MRYLQFIFERHFGVFVVLAGLLYGMCATLFLGLESSWDFRNYHFYNGYAFLGDRLYYDVMPAQIQSYFNPVLDIPLYLIYKWSNASTVSLMYGAFHGLQFTFLALIGVIAFKGETILVNRISALLIALLGSMGAMFQYGVGAFSHDTIVVVFFLASLYTILKSYDSGVGRFKINGLILAGILMGLGVGGKLTGVVGGVALVSAVFLSAGSIKDRFLGATVFGVAMTIAMLGLSGYWMLTLYNEFGNPLFPLYGHIFPSELITLSGGEPGRGFHGIVEKIFSPIIATAEPLRVSHFYWRDTRFAFAYIMLISILFVYASDLIGNIINKKNALLEYVFGTKKPNDSELLERLLFIVVLVVLFLWIYRFGAIRYIAGLEAIAPLFIYVTLKRFGAQPRGALIICTLFFLVTAPMTTSGKRPPFGQDFFKFTETDFRQYQDSLVVMTGFEGTSFVIPFFPQSTRFVRVQATVNWADRRDDSGYQGMRAVAKSVIDDHSGAFQVLYDAVSDKFSKEPDNTDEQLTLFGLKRIEESCRMIEGGEGTARRITLCDVARIE